MISQTPTTLIRITIDNVSGSPQVAQIYLYSEKDKPLHLQNPTTARPYLINDIHLGQEIKENITISGRITLVFADDIDSQGVSYWRKWVALNPFYKNRRVDVLKGTSGQAEGSYSNFFKGVISNIIFRSDETIEIVIKSLLQLTNQDHPNATDGKVSTTISSGDNLSGGLVMTLGTGLNGFVASGHQYLASGKIRIDDEIMAYTSLTDVSAGQKVQFRFDGITRGQFTVDGYSSSTATHDAGATIQQTIVYGPSHPLDIMQTLMLQAGLASGDINTQSFADTINDWLPGALVRAILSDQVKIKDYLRELREVTFTSLFQDENQQIKVNFLAPGTIGATFKKVGDSNEIIFKSVKVDTRQDSRITRVTYEYDEQPDKSKKTKTTFIDLQKELDYKEAKEKTFKSRWLKTDISGASLAGQSAQNIIRVFGGGKGTIEFDLETKDTDLKIGDLFLLSTNKVLTSLGQPISEIKYQVTKKIQIAANRWRFKAFDTRLDIRFGFYAADTIPDYTIANAGERIYGFYSDDNDKMSNGDGGYFYF